MTVYTCVEEPNVGLKIRVKKVDPIKLSRASVGIEMPVRPEYEAMTITGRAEYHPIMDMKTAKEIEGGVERLTHYNERLQIAQAAQNDAVSKVLFYYGTDFELPEGDWEEDDRFFGKAVPATEKHKKVFYLLEHLAAEDTIGLISEIMSLTGIDEALIQQAEDTFRGAMHGSGSTKNVEPDSTGNPIVRVETQ